MVDEKELIGFLTTSQNRLKILKLLNAEGISRPAVLARKLNVTQPYISTLLYQLSKAGLVECYTKEKKSWRAYGITKRGKEILKKIG
jgi:DNA-binding MarR family transcriptional regulator